MLFILVVKFRQIVPALAALSFSLFLSQESLADDGICIQFYKPKQKNEVVFWPPPENAVVVSQTSEIGLLLAHNSAHQQQKGQRKVYTPDVIGRELYTPVTSPDINKLYMAHNLLLGDLLKTDIYADALVKVLVDDKIDTPEEIKKFITNFHGWKSFNVAGSEIFLGRTAQEFARSLDKYVGENVDYKGIDEANIKYGLSVEDLIQLKSNLALFRENSDGKLKLSIMLPILADGARTIKLLEEALVRRTNLNSLAFIPPPSTALIVPEPQKGWGWSARSIKNFGKRIFRTASARARDLSADGKEELLKKAEAIFNSSKSDFSVDTNFLKKIIPSKENQKIFSLSEVVAVVKKAPGFFFHFYQRYQCANSRFYRSVA